MASNGTVSAKCKAAGGLLEISLEELRNEVGKAKLGKWVLGAIAENLSTSGLGYFPQWVLDPVQNPEMRSWQTLWVYDRDGSSRSRVIDAVLRPDEHDVRGILDGLVDGKDEALTPEQKLARIAEIAAS